MSKEELLKIIREGLDEDHRDPEQAFARMVAEGLIDTEGRPIHRERKLIIGNREPEPDALLPTEKKTTTKHDARNP